jgi:hypothetical protein
MKVKDLIAQLSKLDQDLEVYGYMEDESLANKDHACHLFVVDSVDVSAAETFRDEDHTPAIRFGQSDSARNIAFVNLTKDF